MSKLLFVAALVLAMPFAPAFAGGDGDGGSEHDSDYNCLVRDRSGSDFWSNHRDGALNDCKNYSSVGGCYLVLSEGYDKTCKN
jgi:hypothetical protein